MQTLVLADFFLPYLGGSIHWLLNTYSRYNTRDSNRAASSKYTLFGMLVGCKPPRWLESMVPERANSVYGIYALTWELTSTEKGLSRAECFFSLKGLCIW